MKTALGSPGAARVLEAAETRRCYGAKCFYAAWRIGELYMTCGSAGRWCCCGRDVGRETARLLLRGLLASTVLADLERWVQFVADLDHNAVPDEKMDGREALRLVLERLRAERT